MIAHLEGGGLQAGDSLLGAVVLLAAGVGLDGDLLGGAAAGHREGAFGGGHRVVVGLGALVEGVGEGVLRRARGGAGAGDGAGGPLARGEAVAADGHVSVGQRGAVVDLGVGGGGEGHGALADGEGAVGQFNNRHLAVVEYFTFGIVDDNIASLGGESVLSRILNLAVCVCASVGNDRRIAGDVEGFLADLHLNALLAVPVRNLFNVLKSSGPIIVAVVLMLGRCGLYLEYVLDWFPLSSVGYVLGHRRGPVRAPSFEGVAELDRIAGLRGTGPLGYARIHLICRLPIDASAVQIVGDRELRLLPFGGVDGVLCNGAGDGGIPAIELPAVLTRLVAHKLRRRHSSQDILSRLPVERSMLTGQIGNCVTILLTVRNIVAIGVSMVNDLPGDIFVRHLPGDSRRIGHVPLNRGRYNIVAVTKFEPILNMSLRQQTFIRIGSAVFVELICHSKRICLLLYGIRAVEMPCVSSIGRLICVP